MKNNKTYFGFTIGPIYEMMSHSKKTRELWFSSYFFSWYVKVFYQMLIKINGVEIFSPSYVNPPQNSKAGLFPDHIVGGSDKPADECFKMLNEINTAVNQKFIDIIHELGEHKYCDGKTKYHLSTIFKDYLQTSFVVLPCDKVDEKKIVETVDVHLDALERNRYFILGKNEQTCFRCKSLPSVFWIKDNLDEKYKDKRQIVCPFCFVKFACNVCDDACNESGQKKSFRYYSTGEISSEELISFIKSTKEKELNDYWKEYDEISFEANTEAGREFRKLLKSAAPKKEDEKKIKDYHKYMAIVIADGDNLGSIANKVDDPQKFSQTLFNFGDTARKITDQFHGEPVYLGGDDILSFMPTAFKDGTEIITVFDYVQALSRNYAAELNKINQTGTLSFGIHLFYYKAPLSIALSDARDLLYEAKNLPGKNSLVLQLTQHSGQQIKIKFKLCSNQLKNFSELLNGLLNGNIKYPEGIHHNLSRFKTVLTNLHDPKQLDAFMKNRFNEEIHKEKFTGIPKIFEMLKKLLIYHSNGSLKIYSGEAASTAFDEFLSQIKFIKFLAGEK